MDKHSPAPWNWVVNDGEFVASRFAQLVADDGTIVVDDGSASGKEASVVDPETPDGRLIAAAPELLDAVRTLLQVVAGVHHDSVEALLTARGAIAKATGGIP